MSKPHELLDDLVTWAQDPDKWQWQFRCTAQSEWADCTSWNALELYATGAEVRIARKRSMIPVHLLPKGWKVERMPTNSYRVHSPNYKNPGYYKPGTEVYDLLRHIDPESNDD